MLSAPCSLLSALCSLQVAQLQEQRRLGEILLEGAEERNRLRQAATQEARDESAEHALRLASVSSQLANLKETSLRTKEEAAPPLTAPQRHPRSP